MLFQMFNGADVQKPSTPLTPNTDSQIIYDTSKNTAKDTEKQTEKQTEPETEPETKIPNDAIVLIAGQKGEYGKMITYNEGTEFEENFYAYYVPAGIYEITNIGKYTTQVNVYSNETVFEDGVEYPATAASKRLELSNTVVMTVGADDHIEIIEPTEIALVLIGEWTAPETEPPATEPPVTEPPATEPPATEPPVTEPPVTEPVEVVQCEIVDTYYTCGIDILGDYWMQVVCVVENTGTTNLYLSSGKFDVEDNNGHLIDTVDNVQCYPQVIAPGERAYYIDDFNIDNGTLEEEYVIIPDVDIEESEVPLVRLNVSDETLRKTNYGWLEMIGRVENTTNEEIAGFWYVVAILYDKDGKVLCKMFDMPDDIAPGEKITFEMTDAYNKAEVDIEDVERYEFFAYPHKYQW